MREKKVYRGREGENLYSLDVFYEAMRRGNGAFEMKVGVLFPLPHPWI